jgi:cyclopropane-fatty-acyl-phospholipid synthase
VRDDRFEEYRKSIDFIQKYIFPGGMLPSPLVLHREAEKAGLDCVKSIEFGESYSQTLRLWHSRFNDKWDQVTAMGFDDRFRRMWNFYLTSCAATFHYANCDVTQITLSKPE